MSANSTWKSITIIEDGEARTVDAVAFASSILGPWIVEPRMTQWWALNHPGEANQPRGKILNDMHLIAWRKRYMDEAMSLVDEAIRKAKKNGRRISLKPLNSDLTTSPKAA